MRCLERNKTRFYYAKLVDKKDKVNDEGYSIGETELIYSAPILVMANISPATGEAVIQQFGGNEAYDKVLVADNPDMNIDEYSILWVDVVPEFDKTGNVITPNDYVIKKISRSLNSLSIAISKVNVS